MSDFRTPCQILVFWATEPDYQHILVIHEPEMKDVVKVYGPALPETMISEAESMLKDSWFDSEPESSGATLEQRYKDMFQSQLLGLLRNLPQARLRFPPRDGKGIPIMKAGGEDSKFFTWDIVGNLLSLNPRRFAAETVSRATTPGEVGQPTTTDQNATMVVQPPDAVPNPTRAGFISSFYPAVWLGERHVFSFREKLDGFFIPVSSKKVRFVYKGRELTVMLNGLLAMMEPDKETCASLLNEIMCTALLLGVPSTVVRDNDLGEALFYDNGDWGQYSMEISDRRRESLEKEHSTIREEEFERYRLLSEEDLRKIVESAAECTKGPDQSSFANWYIDARTYFEDTAYDQAVMRCWLIIEQHVISMWRELMKSTSTQKSSDPSSMKKALKDLMKADKLTAEEYRQLDDLRERRNKVVHLGSKAAQNEAIPFMTLAERLTRSRLGIVKSVY